MTYGDVLVQITAEAVGVTVDEAREHIDMWFAASGSRGRLDDELPDAEAAELLDQLRKEKPGILNWYLAGRREHIAAAKKRETN